MSLDKSNYKIPFGQLTDEQNALLNRFADADLAID
jgi:hypothetical protein